MTIFAIMLVADQEYNTYDMKSKVQKYFKDEDIKTFKTNKEVLSVVLDGVDLYKTYSGYFSNDGIKNILFSSFGGLFFIEVSDEKTATKITNELILNLNCIVKCHEFSTELFNKNGSLYRKTISYIHGKHVENYPGAYNELHNLFNGYPNIKELGTLPWEELVTLVKNKSQYKHDFRIRHISRFIKLIYEIHY